jgi:hypothetical protein
LCRSLALGLPLLGCGRPPQTALDRSTPIGAPMAKGSLMNVPVKGYHVEAIYGESECSLEGELIAVIDEGLLIYGADEILYEVSRTQLVEIDLELYPSSSNSIYTTTTIGSFSTASHGLWLVVTLPLWLGVGLPLAAAESRASHLHVPDEGWTELAHYARFPHGAFMKWEGRTEPVEACE